MRAKAFISISRSWYFVTEGSICEKAEVFRGRSSHIFCARIIETVHNPRQLMTDSGTPLIVVMRFR
jgi:hypothetical protein